MSSNERASFIPRSRGVCTSIKKTKERERGEKTRQREAERKEEKRKSRKSETREAAAGVEKLGTRIIMEYVGSKGGEENGVRVAYD